MTYQEFRESPLYKGHGNWLKVTFEHKRWIKDPTPGFGNMPAMLPDHRLYCLMLQWEPTNQKFYSPEAIGREECGYCDIISLPHFGINTAEIIDISPDRFRYVGTNITI